MLSERLRHVFFNCYDQLGHVGIDEMVEVISKSYWFPKIGGKCKKHIINCLTCIAYSKKSGKEEGFLPNIPKVYFPLHKDHYGQTKTY